MLILTLFAVFITQIIKTPQVVGTFTLYKLLLVNFNSIVPSEN